MGARERTMKLLNQLKTEAVVVPSEFITTYMGPANGDYVKVYLWLLNNGSAEIDEIADKLDLTERDVKRALKYWQDKEVIKTPALTAMAAAEEKPVLREKYRGVEAAEIMNRLAGDNEFSELLMIVQKYLARTLNERDTQVLAYLYDGLHLSADVLDYLVAYCVDHGHTGIQYMEKLGVDWSEQGIRDVKAAKRRTKQFESSGKGRKAATGKLSGKEAAAEKNEAQKAPRTDYNQLVMDELIESMGD